MSAKEQTRPSRHDQPLRLRGRGHAETVRRRPVLHVCGLNHTRAALGLLEQYAMSPDTIEAVTRELAAQLQTEQALVLSTCNRTEVYAYSERAEFAVRLRERFVELGGDAAEAEGAIPLYEYRGIEAVRHLFAVIGGLDSMILGENLIKQQVRQSYERSQALGLDGGDLHRLVQAAHRCGKRIRTETELNNGTLEVDIAAILRAEQALGGLEGRTCMVIGAGKVGARAARAIAERRPRRLLIVNRTVERAREIADTCCGEAYGLESLAGLLAETDFVLGAAFAPEFVIHPEAYRAATAGRPDAPVCMVDTAMPRILDPALAQMPGVKLFDLEHLSEIVESNRQRRGKAAQQGWRIVEEEVEKFQTAVQSAELAPVIQHMSAQFDRIFEEETAALAALAGSTAESRRIEALQHRLKQRLLHEVIVELKAQVMDQG